MSKQKKTPNRELYDIVGFGNPKFYDQSTNIPIETQNWMRINKIYEVIIQERSGGKHYTLLVGEEDYNSLQELEVDYLIILSYGSWSFTYDTNVKFLNPATNKPIKIVELFGDL